MLRNFLDFANPSKSIAASSENRSEIRECIRSRTEHTFLNGELSRRKSTTDFVIK